MRTSFQTSRHDGNRFAKACILVLVILAAISIFMYTLITAILFDNRIHANSVELGPIFGVLVAASLLLLLHLTYLLTVGWDQLFKHPHERHTAQEAVLVALLCITYICPMAMLFIPLHHLLRVDPAIVLANNAAVLPQLRELQISFSKTLATSLFVCVYGYWAALDLSEILETNALHSRRPLGKQMLRQLRRIPVKAVRWLPHWKHGKQVTHRLGKELAKAASWLTHKRRHHTGYTTSSVSNLRATEKMMWMGVDSLLAITLLSALAAYEWFEEPGLYKLQLFRHFTLKELAVVAALLLRLFSKHLVRLTIAADDFLKHRGWQDAVRRNYLPRSRPPATPAPPIIKDAEFNMYCNIVVAPLESEAGECSIESPLKCMVINCGTGARTAQMLRRIKALNGRCTSPTLDIIRVADTRSVELFGYHHDPDVEDTFCYGKWLSQLDAPGRVVDTHFTCQLNKAQQWAAEADVVIILHSTYDTHEAHRVEAILQGLRHGTVVLARGFADHSLLATVCYQHPDRFLVPTPHYHLWNHGFLREMAAAHQWRIVTSRGIMPVTKPSNPPSPSPADGYHPVKIIRQSLMLDGASFASVVSYLTTQLSEAACDGIREQLRAIAAATPAHEKMLNMTANADDYVYCFITPTEEGGCDNMRVAIVYSDATDQQTAGSSTLGSSLTVGIDIDPIEKSSSPPHDKP